MFAQLVVAIRNTSRVNVCATSDISEMVKSVHLATLLVVHALIPHQMAASHALMFHTLYHRVFVLREHVIQVISSTVQPEFVINAWTIVLHALINQRVIPASLDFRF